jgi:hypothetical protein
VPSANAQGNRFPGQHRFHGLRPVVAQSHTSDDGPTGLAENIPSDHYGGQGTAEPDQEEERRHGAKRQVTSSVPSRLRYPDHGGKLRSLGFLVALLGPQEPWEHVLAL